MGGYLPLPRMQRSQCSSCSGVGAGRADVMAAALLPRRIFSIRLHHKAAPALPLLPIFLINNHTKFLG